MDYRKIMADNTRVTELLSRYLNLNARVIDRETVRQFAHDCDLSPDAAFRVLYSAACGLDTADNKEDRMLDRLYLQPGLAKTDPAVYRNDPYAKTIRIPDRKIGKWELRHESFQPYEPFVRTHPVLTADYREIPQIGYFDEEFTFPSVLENGVEWMTITPNEIETMKEAIREASGNVVTFGLGLGYYAFMVSEKPDVSSVTVIEKDPDVITLFREHLLPQFPHKEKIQVVQADAFDYAERQMPAESFSYAFVDLWHDPSDGLDLYLRMRRLEEKSPETRFSYWIEPSILSLLRHMVWQKLTSRDAAPAFAALPVEKALSDQFLRDLAKDLKRI